MASDRFKDLEKGQQEIAIEAVNTMLRKRKTMQQGQAFRCRTLLGSH